MCGIHFDNKHFLTYCFVCKQAEIEEELIFVAKWGISLCQNCHDQSEIDKDFEKKLKDQLKNPTP